MKNPFVAEIASQLAPLAGMSAAEIEYSLTAPPDEKLGDYAFPCFLPAKTMRKRPDEIARELAAAVKPSALLLSAGAAGPYVNFTVDRAAFVQWALARALAEKDCFGHSAEGAGKTVVVEFSSPNIAKHLGVHHIRSTMIGNALVKLYGALGYRVVSINFLGDWGTQFGILMAAYRKWGDATTLQGDAVANLNALYVRFSAEAKAAPTLRDEGRAWFKRLEGGDAEAVALWQRFREISLAEFEKVYAMLGVRFDVLSGESQYDRRMPETIARLEKAGLAKIDDGALIVDLKAYKMPPLMLRKSDGATLYDTRDVATAEDRWEKYAFARSVYVVGGDQKLHFRQLFKVLELMGYAWAKDCVHVDFGVIRVRSEGGSAKMSTRGGTMIMLKEVLQEATERALKAIEQKNPELKGKAQTAAAVGIGAVVFNDLKHGRIKDVDFDWDTILNFEGETGPYVQYAHARMCSILRKHGRPVAAAPEWSLLREPEEFALAKFMAGFNATVRRAAEANEPSVVSQYLLELCGRFSTYYHKHKVLGEDAALTAARIALVEAARQTVANGLALLGMKAPEEM
jgi:arginyl-tRNA synthetase